MTRSIEFDALEIGYDIPAKPGMAAADVQTPCLILDLDALERNIAKMGAFARDHGLAHRAHGKMHKSVDVARLQMTLGGAVGLCCQKVSEAEAFIRGGITNILVTNQVVDAVKIDRLARLAAAGATLGVCVDDAENVGALSEAATRHGTVLTCLVEIECGQGRCGVAGPEEAVALARAIAAAPGLRFGGIQAYQGAMQHIEDHAPRQAAAEAAIAKARATVAALEAAGLPCETVTGAGTGSYRFEAASGLYTELQCGSYAFMDADYGRIRMGEGARMDQGEWENTLFLLTQVMSHAKPDLAVVDAGLKSQSVDSGLPVIFGRNDVSYSQCSDEHGVVADPNGVLRVGDKLRLVPGHCDPTVNLHDWLVGLRGDVVETVWPVSARGKAS